MEVFRVCPCILLLEGQEHIKKTERREKTAEKTSDRESGGNKNV